MEIPLVSICIPVYNRRDIILTTVKSALAQDYANFEVVVSDNNSDDGTYDLLVEMASREPRLNLFRLSKNMGPVRNWENCVAHSRGEFIKFLWSDDYMGPSFLSQCMALFAPDVGCVFAKTSLYNRDVSEPAKRLLYDHGESSGWVSSEAYIKGLVLGDIARYCHSGTAALFRRESVLEALGFQVPNPLDLDFLRTGAGPDAMMFLSAVLHYDRVGYCAEVVSRYGTGFGSISVKEGELLLSSYNTYYLWIVCEKRPALARYFKTRLFFLSIFSNKMIVKQQSGSLLALIPGAISWPFFWCLFCNKLVSYVWNKLGFSA